MDEAQIQALDGVYVAGQWLGQQPVTRRDGSAVVGMVEIALRTGSDVVKAVVFEQNTGLDLNGVSVSERTALAVQLEGLALRLGDRVLIGATVRHDLSQSTPGKPARVFVNWTCRSVSLLERVERVEAREGVGD